MTPMATPADIGIGIGEASKRTGLSQWQLRKMARDEAIRCRRTGRFLRFHPADVVALEARLWTGRAIADDDFAPGRGAPPQGSHARLSSLPFASAGAPKPSTDEVSA